MPEERLKGEVSGTRLRIFDWGDVPEKYHAFLKQNVDDPSSVIHQKGFRGLKWEANEVIVGSELTGFRTAIEDIGIQFEFFPQNFDPKQKINWRSYSFPRSFGHGTGFAHYPESDAPSLPLRLYVSYKPNSNKMKNFLSNIHQLGNFDCFMISEPIYCLLRKLDPSITDDRFFPVIVNSRGDVDVASMYLFDPIVREDLIDFDHSIQSWVYWEPVSYRTDIWTCEAVIPGYHTGKTISIARSGLANKWLASKDLVYTLKKHGVRGILDQADKTDEFLGRQYVPKDLLA